METGVTGVAGGLMAVDVKNGTVVLIIGAIIVGHGRIMLRTVTKRRIKESAQKRSSN